jgi:EAL domain-containing protein (putative c-di-GMP-specific phosphodiesterase class I)
MAQPIPQPSEQHFRRLQTDLTGWEDPVGRLMQALKQNELELFAQPIVSLAQPGVIPMAEVLVRMREEEEALLPPGLFLEVFEYCGMMHELDRWVARQVVARLARGSKVPCYSINVSSQTLTDERFLKDVVTSLRAANVRVGAIGFEISEDDLIAMPASAVEFAGAARRLGFSVILDSFGRRPDALSPLRELSADYVKVDGVIVRGLDTNQVARDKLDAVVRVSEAVGVKLIGECVETDAAIRRLREQGVTYAQGYGIGPPAPIEEVASA